MSYKLSIKADRDFKEIYKYTYKQFGKRQASKYTFSLEACFLLLSENPDIGQKCDQAKKELLCHKHKGHTVFYRRRKQDIFILRILHKKMVPKLHL